MILMAEVMFDNEKDISGENPLHMEFVRKIAIPMFESWGYPVVILRNEKDYLNRFYRIIERPLKYEERKGMKAGFPVIGKCEIKRDCKTRTMQRYLRSLGEPYIQYIGIASDEPKRLASMHKNPGNVSLLEKYGYNEQMAWQKCKDYNLLSPSYGVSKRGGCWFCPYARLEEHELIRCLEPAAWQRFCDLELEDNVANYVWNVHKESLIERELYFRKKDDEKRVKVSGLTENGGRVLGTHKTRQKKYKQCEGQLSMML